MRCSFWCKMTIGSMYIRGYTEVWVKGGSTVLIHSSIRLSSSTTRSS